jgi:hypothetical protein
MTPHHEQDLSYELTTLVVIETDCTGNSKSDYQTIITMTTPYLLEN